MVNNLFLDVSGGGVHDGAYDISSFISWFITQFTNILRFVYSQLDRLILVGNFSLLDFCITILILGAIISIVVATANTYSVNVSIHEHSSDKEDSK